MGFPSVRELFYDAQRDYIERFVLEIDPRKNETVKHAFASDVTI